MFQTQWLWLWQWAVSEVTTQAAVNDVTIAVSELQGGTTVHYLPLAIGEVMGDLSTQTAVNNVSVTVAVEGDEVSTQAAVHESPMAVTCSLCSNGGE